MNEAFLFFALANFRFWDILRTQHQTRRWKRLEPGSVYRRIVANPVFGVHACGPSMPVILVSIFCCFVPVELQNSCGFLWSVFPADCFWVLRFVEPQCPACKFARLLWNTTYTACCLTLSWAKVAGYREDRSCNSFVGTSCWPNNGSPTFHCLTLAWSNLNHFFRQSIIGKLLHDRMACQSKAVPSRIQEGSDILMPWHHVMGLVVVRSLDCSITIAARRDDR